MSDYAIPNADKLAYQYDKPLDIWSGALWLGAALEALSDKAQEGDPWASTWIAKVPDEVKACWPGIFPEFPYA